MRVSARTDRLNKQTNKQTNTQHVQWYWLVETWALTNVFQTYHMVRSGVYRPTSTFEEKNNLHGLGIGEFLWPALYWEKQKSSNFSVSTFLIAKWYGCMGHNCIFERHIPKPENDWVAQIRRPLHHLSTLRGVFKKFVARTWRRRDTRVIQCTRILQVSIQYKSI